MNDRRRTAERRRLELVARIDVQRFRLRLQSRLLVSSRPWMGLAHQPGWRRTLGVAVLAAAGCAALVVRWRLARSTAPAVHLARLAIRGWLAGRFAWRLARQWRDGRARPALVEGTPS